VGLRVSIGLGCVLPIIGNTTSPLKWVWKMIRDDKLQQRYALRHYMLCRLTQVFLCGAW